MHSKNSFILIPLFDCSIPGTLCNINLKWCSRWCGIFCWILNELEIHFYWYYSVKIDQNKANQIKYSKKKNNLLNFNEKRDMFLSLKYSFQIVTFIIKSNQKFCVAVTDDTEYWTINIFSILKLKIITSF